MINHHIFSECKRTDKSLAFQLPINELRLWPVSEAKWFWGKMLANTHVKGYHRSATSPLLWVFCCLQPDLEDGTEPSTGCPFPLAQKSTRGWGAGTSQFDCKMTCPCVCKTNQPHTAPHLICFPSALPKAIFCWAERQFSPWRTLSGS